MLFLLFGIRFRCRFLRFGAGWGGLFGIIEGTGDGVLGVVVGGGLLAFCYAIVLLLFHNHLLDLGFFLNH